ncbi:disease resistance-like protein DSC1 [Neltuma alba]|uniref:disease resistance-like protein DSC1 n=1 Tax=Neltuma alba TaxID=207710 RepID=UPI0010A2C9A0|nr:disease resistance-like protein DSC1 [Prosopis alba]
MASSSSSAPSSQSPKKYDVFINFRGEDTRFNFTGHFHEALCRNQIDTYIDYRLEKGDEVWPSLEKAIEDSTLFIVIFSKNYASSTWCLKELAKILECSKNQGCFVMPVFHRVDPSHVRKQSRSYQKAFEEHERKRSINNQQLQKWREALTQAANLSGWHCSFNRDEAELIKEIVNCVTQKLGPRYRREDYLEGLIGIHKRMAAIESLLGKVSNNSGCQFIGIWGMGGLGKTTLAKALFNKLHFTYEGSCFLANVREESKKNGTDALREKIVWKLLGDKESHFGNAIYPYTMSRLGRKKVFIVLDDVEQLENLVGRRQFGSGSKVLITTRDKQVLGKEVDDIYVLYCLDPDEAFQLFSLNAFKKGYSDPKIRGLVEKVTEYASGNPLALKVLGSFLHSKKQEAWKSQLEKLQKFPCPKVNDILRLSFEGLDDEEEKNIFLHIACFFNYDYDVESVKKLLDACSYSIEIGLARLEDKALLDIDRGKICMHSLIKQMGKQIVREESLNYPTWCNIFWIFKKSVEILKKNMGSIEGMIMNLLEVEETRVIIKAFRSMPNLKFLRVYGNLNVQLMNKLNASGMMFLSRNLMLLDWVGCPLKTLPTTFKGENLVEINMPNSKLTKLWDGEQSLCDLVLRGCKNLTSLTSNTHLKSLRNLDMTGCSGLCEFSVTTNEKYRSVLKLCGAAINGELCSSSGHLSKIYLLNLEKCKGVTSLHKLVDARTLRRLNAEYCNKLASNLRSTFDEMRALQYLELTDCSELYEVPDNISFLSSLGQLDLSRSNIETLPLSIKNLSRLEVLFLNGCERLRSLPQLPPSIRRLSTNDCLSLETLHSPLMSRDKEGKHYFYFSFRNCMKLDGLSIKAVEATVLLSINNNKDIDYRAAMEYPGERVAEWVMYRTTQSLVTVDLSSIPQPWDGAFIFCAVIPRSLSKWTNINAKLFIDGQYAWESRSAPVYGPLLVNHVVLWYDAELRRQVQRKIEDKKRQAQSNTYHPLIRIEFMWEGEDLGERKEWGVWPTSTVEYQNYIKKIQLASLHPHRSSNATQSASQKRKYHSLLR